MVTREEIQGKWNQVKGRIQERWGQLTDDDLSRAQGNTDQLVGVIQQKTGESRSEIERFIDQAVAGGTSAVRKAADTAREYAQRASEAVSGATQRASTTARNTGSSVRSGYDQASVQMQQGFEQAEEMVRTKPLESIAMAFGVGLISGVVVSLVLKSR